MPTVYFLSRSLFPGPFSLSWFSYVVKLDLNHCAFCHEETGPLHKWKGNIIRFMSLRT